MRGPRFEQQVFLLAEPFHWPWFQIISNFTQLNLQNSTNKVISFPIASVINDNMKYEQNHGSTNMTFISRLGFGKLCALHCIRVNFCTYHNVFLCLLKRYVRVRTFSTTRKNAFQLRCISGNGINRNHWHQIFSSLDPGRRQKGGVWTAPRLPLPQGRY